MIFEEDHYYQLRSMTLELPIADTEKTFRLRREDAVLCIGVTTQQRKRYAVLLHQDEGGETVHLMHRVSRFNRGRGEWRELNPMLVVALSDQIPSL